MYCDECGKLVGMNDRNFTDTGGCFCDEHMPGEVETFQVWIKLADACMGPFEVARLLRQTADRVEAGLMSGGTLLSIDGNTVGSYSTEYEHDAT